MINKKGSFYEYISKIHRWKIQFITMGLALGLSDFSPHTQDLLAIADIANHAGQPLNSLLNGDFPEALLYLSHEWSSLPIGPLAPKKKDPDKGWYEGQSRASYSEVNAYYQERLKWYEAKPSDSSP